MKTYAFILVSALSLLTSCVGSLGISSGLPTLRFDNQGHLENPDELEALRRSIAASPQTVVIYMHGWKGKASSWDANVKGFARHLEIVRERSYTPYGRKLTGIFFTWNARHLPGLLENGSYHPTRNRADRISSGDGVAMALKTLSEAASGQPREKFIVAGHSMGARILGRVIGRDPGLLRHISLALLINAADDSGSGRQIMQKVSAYRYPAGSQPQLVWVTSETDWATKNLFSAAEHGQTAVGHEKQLWTHRFDITQRDDPARGIPPNGKFTPLLHPPPVRFRNIVVKAIHGHNDIWEESMRVILNFCLWGKPY